MLFNRNFQKIATNVATTVLSFRTHFALECDCANSRPRSIVKVVTTTTVTDVSWNIVATQCHFLRQRFRVEKKSSRRLDNANTRSRLSYGRLSTPLIVRLSYPRTSELSLIGSGRSSLDDWVRIITWPLPFQCLSPD